MGAFEARPSGGRCPSRTEFGDDCLSRPGREGAGSHEPSNGWTGDIISIDPSLVGIYHSPSARKFVERIRNLRRQGEATAMIVEYDSYFIDELIAVVNLDAPGADLNLHTSSRRSNESQNKIRVGNQAQPIQGRDK